jgi:hypothetical protein
MLILYSVISVALDLFFPKVCTKMEQFGRPTTMYEICMIVKGNISTFSNGYTILLHAAHFSDFHRTQKITCLGPFLPSSMGAQYSYRDHTSHVFLGHKR